MSYYAPNTAAIAAHLPRRLVQAYETAGLPQPKVDLRLDALDAEPTVKSVLERITVELSDGKNTTGTAAKNWAHATIDDYRQAMAADALRRDMARIRDVTLAKSAPARIEAAVADLRPAFTAAVDTLTKAVAELPADNPLDLDAVIATDTTKQWKAAIGALKELSTYANIYAVGQPFVLRSNGNAGKTLGDLAPVLRWPEFAEAENIDRIRRVPIAGRDENREQLRDLDRMANKHGLDRALIEVARGRWPRIQFELAASNAERWERIESAGNAVSVMVREVKHPGARVKA